MAQTFFISDCHLDASRPQLIKVFTRFVRERAPAGDALYILGDLFDHWVGDDAPLGALAPVAESLKQASTQLPVYFMHGNRDFLVGARFSCLSGCRLLRATEVIDLHGQATLLMHGDLLCTDDRAYQRYRRLVRNPVSQRLILSLPLTARQSLGQRLRGVSQRTVAVKAEDIMDVCHDTVADYIRKFKVTQLIHGHTHRPGIHTAEMDGQKWKRVVLGDWREYGSLLSVTDGEMRFEVLR